MKVTRLTESDTGQPVQFLAMFSIMTQYYVRNVVKVLHIQLHQTWNLSKNLHRWIFRLKILHRQFYLISTVLVRKKHKKWVKMEKFTPLAKILHCHRHWRDGQIPPLFTVNTTSNRVLTTFQSSNSYCVHTLSIERRSQSKYCNQCGTSCPMISPR